MIGSASPDLSNTSPNRYIAEVLNTVLGRGMSSRLFLNVREKKGLAYSIHSSAENFEDTGAFIIYGGVNPEKVNDALVAIGEELDKIKNELVSDSEMKKVKQMLIGGFDLSHDDPLKLAKWYGVNRMLGEKDTIAQAQEKINKVTSDEVMNLAKDLLDKEKLIIAAIGPHKDKTQFENFLIKSS